MDSKTMQLLALAAVVGGIGFIAFRQRAAPQPVVVAPVPVAAAAAAQPAASEIDPWLALAKSIYQGVKEL